MHWAGTERHIVQYVYINFVNNSLSWFSSTGMYTGHTVRILLVLKMNNRILTFKGLFFLRLHIWLLLALWLWSQIEFFFLLSNGVLVKVRPDLLGRYRGRGKGVVGGCGSRQRALLWEGAAWHSGEQMWRGFSYRARSLKFTVWQRIAGLFVIMYLFLLTAFFPGLSCFCELWMLKLSVPHLRLQNVQSKSLTMFKRRKSTLGYWAEVR